MSWRIWLCFFVVFAKTSSKNAAYLSSSLFVYLSVRDSKTTESVLWYFMLKTLNKAFKSWLKSKKKVTNNWQGYQQAFLCACRMWSGSYFGKEKYLGEFFRGKVMFHVNNFNEHREDIESIRQSGRTRKLFKICTCLNASFKIQQTWSQNQRVALFYEAITLCFGDCYFKT